MHLSCFLYAHIRKFEAGIAVIWGDLTNFVELLLRLGPMLFALGLQLSAIEALP